MVRRFVLFLFCAGCDQATLVSQPDTGVEDACVAHAVAFCDASPSGCIGGGQDPYVSLLPADAAFPVGCTANVIGTDRDPVTGICKLAAACTCDSDDAGATSWSCTP